MADRIDELAHAFARFPGIGPRQAKRFVFHLLAAPAAERAALIALITALGKDVRQCPDCLRYYNGTGGAACAYCMDAHRDDAVLMLVEKDQDLAAVERAGTYKGRYFVLGGVLMLSGKGAIREKELVKAVEKRLAKGLMEIVLALSATSEGEHTADRVRELLAPLRDKVRITTLGRGLATGSELEYSDAETLRAALSNRRET
ncbi:MAG TPA: toprim domain-containing protein [Candidatus Paceibacterota bacterium]|nr:toprim domain-containing protein [Candidatus Paceibacterota bacterium]